MKPAVRQAFVAFSTKFEGCDPWMYLDVKGLVTCAIGNLIDNSAPGGVFAPCPGYVLGLSWIHKNGGTSASPPEILAEWNLVKNLQSMKLAGGGYFASVTKLRLTPDGVQKLVMGKLDSMEVVLKRRFSQFEDWPCDAQMDLFSMSWANGENFRFPKYEAFMKAQQFAIFGRDPTGKEIPVNGAAIEGHMDIGTKGQPDYNPGLIPRNAANVILLSNAQRVLRSPQAYSMDTLYYPTELPETPDVPTGSPPPTSEQAPGGPATGPAA